MKFLIPFLFVLNSCNQIQFGNTVTIKTIADEFFSAVEQCKSVIDVGEDITQKFLSHNPSLNHNEKCFVACVMEKLNLITTDGLMVKNTFMLGIDIVIPDDEEKKKLAQEIISSCESVNDSDKCESAVLISKCINDGKEAKGLKMLF